MKSDSVFDKFWNRLVFVKDLISMMLFLTVAGVVLALVILWWLLPRTPHLTAGTTLVLDLSSPIVEGRDAGGFPDVIKRLTGNGSSEIRMYDLLVGLSRASSDPSISQLAIVANGGSEMGMAQARELSAAIRLFKKSSKKPVLAYALSPDQKQYLVMAAADKVFLDPEGQVLLEGLSAYRPYFRSALVDKLGVDIHLFRVGEFKSAAEPFIRDDASPAAREASLFWMNDVWSRYLVDMGALRKKPAQEIKKNVDNMDVSVAISRGDLSDVALKNGWVDELVTDVEFSNRLAKAGRWNEKTQKIDSVDMTDYLSMHANSNNGQVAIITIQGEIVDGEPGTGRASAPEVVSRIRQVLASPGIKAVVIRIDSPGGSVLGSELIRREVSRLVASGRPVVVSMGNVAASGGYWIATASNLIIADQSTVTGSIGIFGLYPNFTRALDRLGVHTDGVATSPMAGSLDPTRPLSPRIASAVQDVIDHGYEKFLMRVSRARGMSVDDVDKIARGRVWSGAQAKERKLVDREGGLLTAVLAASRQAGIQGSPNAFVVDGESSLASWIASPKMEGSIQQAITGKMSPLSQLPIRIPEWLDDSLKGKGTLKFKAYAHCLCEG